MSTIPLAIAVVATLYALHLAALWMEQRGWIFYKKRRASSGTFSAAVLGVQQILDPGAAHVLQAKHRKEPEAHPHGDPPDPEKSESGAR